MPDLENRRRWTRFRFPVIVNAPALSDLPIIPEDVSTAGFRAILESDPEMGLTVCCAIEIAGEVFVGCEGEVVWVKKAGRGGYEAGVSVKASQEDGVRLGALLEEASAKFGGLVSPVI